MREGRRLQMINGVRTCMQNSMRQIIKLLREGRGADQIMRMR